MRFAQLSPRFLIMALVANHRITAPKPDEKILLGNALPREPFVA